MTIITQRTTRRPLSRDRVLGRAVKLADDVELGAVSMRRLGADLGVEAMSLYNHVASKEALLDAMVEHVGAELNTEIAGLDGPDPAADWRAALRTRSLAARVVMLRHPWMPTVLESRTTMSLEVVRYYDGVVGILTRGRVRPRPHAPRAARPGQPRPRVHPGAVRPGGRRRGHLRGGPGPDGVGRVEPHGHARRRRPHRRPRPDPGVVRRQSEFEFGLDVVLDGLERRRPRKGPRSG